MSPPVLPSRYRHLDPPEHASGGFGEVWTVTDTFLGRTVAYKRVAGSGQAAEIVAEASLAAAARSRHVVEIYDIIVNDHGEPDALVMEFLDGPELAGFDLDDGDGCADYLVALYQVVWALRDLHDIGITHRDLKPDNVRRSGSGVLKVIDFGIAVQGDGYVTNENRGTLIFAAPELYQTGIEIAPPMDVYAFGVMAWVLTGASLPAQLREMPPVNAGSVGRLAGRYPCIGAEVGESITAALSASPNDRPTAAQLLEVLHRRLTFGRHVGVFTYHRNRELRRIDRSSPSAAVAVGSVGRVRVDYDGNDFRIAEVEGQVWLNNTRAAAELVMPPSCVFSFGHPNDGAQRQHVSFSSSSPGVVV